MGGKRLSLTKRRSPIKLKNELKEAKAKLDKVQLAAPMQPMTVGGEVEKNYLKDAIKNGDAAKTALITEGSAIDGSDTAKYREINVQNIDKIKTAAKAAKEAVGEALAALGQREAGDETAKAIKAAQDRVSLALDALKNAKELKKTEELRRSAGLAQIWQDIEALGSGLGQSEKTLANPLSKTSLKALDTALYAKKEDWGSEQNKFGGTRIALAEDLTKAAKNTDGGSYDVARIEIAAKSALKIYQKAKAAKEQAWSLLQSEKIGDAGGAQKAEGDATLASTDKKTDARKAAEAADKLYGSALSVYKNLRAAQELADEADKELDSE